MKQNLNRATVKGTSRRVVIVPCGNDSVFEQVIYIVRDEWATGRGITADHILQEAEALIRSESAPVEEKESEPVFPHPLLLLLFLFFLLFLVILVYLRFS